MVPASAVAVLLPAPSHPLPAALAPSPDPLSHAVAGAVAVLARTSMPLSYAAVGLMAWAAGAAVMLGLAAHRQRAFVRSLGQLRRLSKGTYQSAAIAEPMVVGVWQPRVVLPADFAARYTPEERALVLAHERAHVRRGDPLVNALATGWLCLSWFNPLMYWAIARLHFDQELACDAQVLATTGAARRRYAGALLKTQLVADAFAAVPAGCHWKSGHPLKERVAVLRRPLPGPLRRSSGILLALTLIAAGSYAVWAQQPAPPASRVQRAPAATDASLPSVYGSGTTRPLRTASAELSPSLCAKSLSNSVTLSLRPAANVPLLSDCVPAVEQPSVAPVPVATTNSSKASSRMCPKARARANALLNQKNT